jgi:hypothetical protein
MLATLVWVVTGQRHFVVRVRYCEQHSEMRRDRRRDRRWDREEMLGEERWNEGNIEKSEHGKKVSGMDRMVLSPRNG